MKKMAILLLVFALAGCEKKENVNGHRLTFSELESALTDCDMLFSDRILARKIINKEIGYSDINGNGDKSMALTSYVNLVEEGLVDKSQDIKEVSLVCQAIRHQYNNP